MDEVQNEATLAALKQQTVNETDSAVLEKLLDIEDIWNFEDQNYVKESMELIINAEVRIKEIPIRLKELDAKPQRDQLEIEWGNKRIIAEIEQENQRKIAEIQEDNKREIALINAEIQAKIAKAPYRWRSHLVWMLGILGAIALHEFLK